MSEEEERFIVIFRGFSDATFRGLSDAIGPFDTVEEARSFASHYSAGQVAFSIIPLISPESLEG